jgi:hypothetical protein
MFQFILSTLLFIFSGWTSAAGAVDLDFYGEQSTWLFERSETSSHSSFEDISSARVRAYAGDHVSAVRPYVLMAGQRERVNQFYGYERLISRLGAGIRFSNPTTPLSLFVEGRHFAEKRKNGLWKAQSGEEIAFLLSLNGNTHQSDSDDLTASWYAELSQIIKSKGGDIPSGSGWFRLSAVSMGSRDLALGMHPIDASFYHECVQGCRSWIFLGVGLALDYQVWPLSMGLRAQFGERFDRDMMETIHSRDAARFLLVLSGDI